MKVSSVIPALFIAVAFSAVPSEASPGFEQELIKVNREYDDAIMLGDKAALDRIFAEEFIYTNPKCEVRDKRQQIASLSSGEAKIESAKSDDVRIRVYGETAVMTGHFTATEQRQGKKTRIDERYTAVWVKRQGRWQLVAEQGNLQKPNRKSVTTR